MWGTILRRPSIACHYRVWMWVIFSATLRKNCLWSLSTIDCIILLEVTLISLLVCIIRVFEESEIVLILSSIILFFYSKRVAFLLLLLLNPNILILTHMLPFERELLHIEDSRSIRTRCLLIDKLLALSLLSIILTTCDLCVVVL